jgi:hypothetical protein
LSVAALGVRLGRASCDAGSAEHRSVNAGLAPRCVGDALSTAIGLRRRDELLFQRGQVDRFLLAGELVFEVHSFLDQLDTCQRISGLEPVFDGIETLAHGVGSSFAASLGLVSFESFEVSTNSPPLFASKS